MLAEVAEYIIALISLERRIAYEVYSSYFFVFCSDLSVCR